VISVVGTKAPEGTSRQPGDLTKFEFTVTSTGCPQPGAAQFQTVAYTAGPNDFIARSGELSFKDGDFSRLTITVLVVPDAEPEDNECFSVQLPKAAGNVKVGTSEAAGIIVDDDRQRRVPPGQVLGFVCSE
jgi:hypothetical protein